MKNVCYEGRMSTGKEEYLVERMDISTRKEKCVPERMNMSTGKE